MKILLVTSAKKHSNTDCINKEFMSLTECRGHSVILLHTDNIANCDGCGYCIVKGKCKVTDSFSNALEAGFDAIVFSGAVYFFDLNSGLSKALERLYCKSLQGVPLGLVLMSGSQGKDSGLDLIEKRFERIDYYCGTVTMPYFNKVTYDRRVKVTDTDSYGLLKLITDLEVYHEEVKSKEKQD